MFRPQLKALWRQVFKVVAGGPVDKTRSASVIGALDQLTDSAVLREDLPVLLATNNLRGTDKVVRSLAERTALETAGVLTVATTCYVGNTAAPADYDSGVIGPAVSYVVARNETLPATEGFLAYLDGGTTTDTIRCEWVPAATPAAALAAFEPFNPQASIYNTGTTVKYVLNGALRLFQAKRQQFAPVVAPTTGASDDLNWQEVSPPGADVQGQLDSLATQLSQVRRLVSVSPSVTGATYAVQASDAGNIVPVTYANPTTITLPAGVLPVNAVLEVAQLGTGRVSLAAGSGVNLYPADKLRTAERYSSVGLWQFAPDKWMISNSVA